MFCLKCGVKLGLDSKYCINCGEPTQLKDENNIGKINIIREKKFFGWAIPFTVYVDDTLLGKLTNGTTLSTKVGLGNHEIVFKSTESDVVSEIRLTEDKKEVNVYIIPKMGLIAAKPYIREIEYK